MNKLISIIIPIYNTETFLRQCVDSVINQTYKNLEIILVDDGSTDNSGKICDEYALKDNRIKVIHKKNGGVSSARNAGLDIAKGDYIGFVDSDDFIEKDMYESLLNTIIRTKSQVVVCNWFKGVKNNWIQNKIFPTKEKLTVNEALENFYWCMFCWNKLFDIKIIGKIRFPVNCGYGEDISFCLDIYKLCENIICLDKCKYYYRTNYNSALNAHKFKKIYLLYIDVLQKEIEYVEKNDLIELKNKIYKHQIHTSTAWLGFIALEDKYDVESAKILLKYIRKNLFPFLKTKEKISKKLFILISLINFNFARKIYRLALKLKVIK